MRVTFGISCTAITCAGAGVGMASCSSSSSAPPQTPFDGSMGDGAVFEVDSGGDAPGQDAGKDVTVTPMDSGVDATVDAAPEAGCAPRGITGFQVPPYVHANSQVIICTNPQDYWFVQQCLSDAATLETCAAFADSGPPDAAPEAGPVITSAACAQCLLTPEQTDAGWGPGVQGPVVAPNIAGCIELADQTDAGLSCAMTVQAAAACAEYACTTSCPVTDDPSRIAYSACAKTAATTVCKTYTQAATDCIAQELADGGPVAVGTYCFSSMDPTAQYDEIALYFCSS